MPIIEDCLILDLSIVLQFLSSLLIFFVFFLKGCAISFFYLYMMQILFYFIFLN